jgi:hypothetical protein
MTIYSKNYHRSIYETHYGKIPKDSLGRSYEIHHLDGNHSNNDINNLKCVSIQEHFAIHYRQSDWGACLLIANRMTLTPNDYKKLGELQRGKNNPSYDHTVYNFYHKNGMTETCTQYELRIKHNLNGPNLSEVIRGNQKSVKGWRMTKEELPDMTGKLQPNCNTTYNFQHKSGITEHMTQRQLYLKYKLPCRSGISQLISGKVKSYKGWRAVR